jgi:hypothetical protein
MLTLAGAQLARDQAQIGLDLVCAAKAGHLVQGGHERRGRHRPHTGNGPKQPDPRIGGGQRLDPGIRVGHLLVDVPHPGQERRDLGEQPFGQGQGPHPDDEGLRPPTGHPVAVLPEQRADHRDVAGARAHQGVAHREASPHVPLGVDRRWAGR